MITLNSIIGEEWNSPIDNEVNALISSQPQLEGFKLVSPFSSQIIDIFINEIETHLKNRNLKLTQENINEAYKELHWYTQYQLNLWEYLNYFKNIRGKYKTVLEYLIEVKKYNFEVEIQGKIKTIYWKKEKELINFEKDFIWKKMTTTENKFLWSKIQVIEDKYASELFHYTWTKLNHTVLWKLNRDKLLLEYKRKILIIEKIVWYIDQRYKAFQEQIMSNKKIIDNLIYLYNNTKN